VKKPLPLLRVIPRFRNHNLFKHHFLINIMEEKNKKPEEDEEALKKKAKELEEKE